MIGLSSNIFKMDETNYVISGKIINIQTGSIIKSATINHTGNLNSFSKSIEKLANKLTGGKNTVALQTENKGHGQFFISSTPKGASIKIDNIKYNEKTDAFLKNIPAGQHSLTLIKGSIGIVQPINIIPNQINKVDLQLRPLKSKMQIVSDPFNASVSVDGFPIGKTPLTYELKTGVHIIKITSNGFLDFQKRVVLKLLEPLNLDIKLKKLPTFQINSNPSGAEVYLNGFFKGKTPFEMMNYGHRSYSVTIKKDGYEDVSQIVRLKPLTAFNLDVKLKQYSNEYIYKGKLSSWKNWNYFNFTMAIIPSLASFSEFQQASSAFDEKIFAEDSLRNADSLKNIAAWEEKAHSKNEQVVQHNQSKNFYLNVSIVFWGIAMWNYFPEPEIPKVTLQIIDNKRKSYQMTYNILW